MVSFRNRQDIWEQPAALLRDLIHFDTTNPPGNEKACVDHIDAILTGAGFSTRLVGKDENRPNLLTRLKGRGDSPPLMLYGHVDVVTTEGQKWTHPPFEGTIADGAVWGRGALDMKCAVVMMLCALLRSAAEGFTPAGDVVLAVLSDEEAGGHYGARYLVEHHGEHFQNIRYAIGEFGGASLYIGGRKLYPVQVSEKQSCHIRVTLHGPGGHGARPIRGGAMAKAARLLDALDRHMLPVHVTPVTRSMIETIVSVLPFPKNLVLKQLLHPPMTNVILNLLGEKRQFLCPLLRNTASAVMIRGGNKHNVIPSEVFIDLDCRLLPGFTPGDMLEEFRHIAGTDMNIEVVSFEPGPDTIDMGLFDTLGQILRDADPDGTPLPMLLPAVTDGRFFGSLGIQTYGFTPMNLPPDFNFFEKIHAADERIPIDALEFGTRAMYELVRRYH